MMMQTRARLTRRLHKSITDRVHTTGVGSSKHLGYVTKYLSSFTAVMPR